MEDSEDMEPRELTKQRPVLRMLASGEQVGRYSLVRKLGQGGMGQAWLAMDPELRNPKNRDGHVVLKFLPDALRCQTAATEEFKAAYRRVRDLHHEHICPLFDLGDEPGLGCFQVMLFIPGVTLWDLWKQEDPSRSGLALRRVLELLKPVASGLDYAHRKGIVHRDIKPGNILMDPKTGDVHVIDFGLAAEVRTSMSRHSRQQLSVSGTESYMAPEQWMGQTQDGKSDQWALAVVAWELLTGSLPFQGSGMALGFAVSQAPLSPFPGKLLALQPVFEKAMAKDRKQRFESCDAFLKALVAASRPAAQQVIVPKQPVILGFPANASTAATPPLATNPGRTRPALLEAPFDKQTAAAAQAAWARYLGINAVVTNSVGIKFRVIPPGEFRMGSPGLERGRKNDEQPHRVVITEPKLFGVFPVTQDEWTRVLGSNSSKFKTVKEEDTTRFPVENVSWDDCQWLLSKLNAAHGIKGFLYRLPSEAEWEYACRAGTTTPFWFGSDLNGTEANCNGNFPYETSGTGPCQQGTSAVGSYSGNAFGVYDTHGNVSEWCEDWYAADYYKSSLLHDPQGPNGGSYRLLRGGSWDLCPMVCRSACRHCLDPASCDSGIGIRLLCELV